MNENRTQYVSYFEQRFGVVSTTWDPYDLIFRSQSVHLVGKGLPELEWQIEDRGFRIARPTSHAFKPTTRGIQWLGDRIKASRVSVSEEEMAQLLDRKSVTPTAESSLPSRGFVAIVFRGLPAGCGFWTGDELRTQISKAHGREFPRASLGNLVP